MGFYNQWIDFKRTEDGHFETFTITFHKIFLKINNGQR